MDVRETYNIPEDVTLYEGEEDLPGDLEDLTARSYQGPLIHGRCPKCEKEGGVTVFRRGVMTHCTGTDEVDPHMTEWEMVEA